MLLYLQRRREPLAYVENVKCVARRNGRMGRAGKNDSGKLTPHG